MKGLKKQQGFSAVDFVVGAVVVGGFFILAWPYIEQGGLSITSGGMDVQVETMAAGAKCYRNATRTYAGMDNDELRALECVTADSVFTNDFGGTNTIAPSSSSPATAYVITVSGITSDGLGERKAREYSAKGDSASYSGGTLTIEKSL